jgi:hypothetical protein
VSDPVVVFRSGITRVVRGIPCLALVGALAWGIYSEATFQGIGTGTRAGWLAVTIAFELVMLTGLQRLWAVCLIIDEQGVIARNFRGDIRYRRSEIKGIEQADAYASFGVELRLKTGSSLRLDGLTWPLPAPTERAIADIRQALGLQADREVLDRGIRK